MRGPVANQFPTAEGAYRIAIVGEAPGADECRLGYPFAGAAGWTLNSALSAVGLRREECLIANICQHRPGANSNDFSLLEWTGDEVQAGIAQLLRDLAQWPPHLVVCLGNVPLHLFRHGNVAPPRTPSGYKWPSKVTQWRGSLFTAHETLPPYKVLACWHPAYVNRVWSKMFDLRQDMIRAREEGSDPVLTLPELDMAWGPAQ